MNNDLRREVIQVSYVNQLGHIASALSMVDLLDVFFGKLYKPDRGDLFYCGKPYGSQAFDAVMHKHGFGRVNTKFSGLQKPSEHIHMVEATLGNALGLAVGAAYGKRLKGEDGVVHVLMGDAAMTQGCAWEAVQLAAKLKLGNINLMIDNNEMGILEREQTLRNFHKKMQAFGWNTSHPEGVTRSQGNSPIVKIYETVKGKGVSFMKNNPEWHYKTLDEEHYKKAMEELSA